VNGESLEALPDIVVTIFSEIASPVIGAGVFSDSGAGVSSTGS